MAIYPPGPLKFVWQYLSSTLSNFKVKLLGYREYTVLLTQTGLSIDPTAVVLENTLDSTFTWTYTGGGDYTITGQNSPFKDVNKVAISMGPSATSGGISNIYGYMCNYEILSPNTLSIYVADYTLFPLDGALSNVEFSIKVYL
jgi:hypothetical protein